MVVVGKEKYIMAQQTSSTANITTKNGKVITNKPINPKNIVRAISTTSLSSDGRDRNQYPIIRMFIVDVGVQDWFYALGDEATRDSDYTTLNNSINP